MSEYTAEERAAWDQYAAAWAGALVGLTQDEWETFVGIYIDEGNDPDECSVVLISSARADEMLAERRKRFGTDAEPKPDLTTIPGVCSQGIYTPQAKQPEHAPDSAEKWMAMDRVVRAAKAWHSAYSRCSGPVPYALDDTASKARAQLAGAVVNYEFLEDE